jgi:hypothetical protein
VTSRARWGAVWLTWVALFAAAEGAALRSGHSDAPLSSHLRTVLGARRRPVVATAGRVAYVAGAVWLYAHLYGADD